MDFVASITDTVFRPLKEYFGQTYGYIMSCGQYIEELGHEMNELKSKRDDIKRKVEAAERQSMEATSHVKWWLKCVADLEDAAVQIDAEYREQQRLRNERSPGIRATYYLSKKADETRAEAASLKEKGNFDKVADELVQMPVEEMPSVPVFGMEEQLQELHACFRDGGIVGIYGMAGVGKTELLNKFNNEFLNNSRDTNVVMYIEVGQEFNQDDFQKVIGDRIGVPWESNKPTKERGKVLFRVLSKMNFVLLLDDVWEPIKLQFLGIPVQKQNSMSKIVLTTRIEDVCDRMDVRRKLKMECLPPKPAWELFCEKAGEHLTHKSQATSKEIKDHAMALATKCGGHPLALITVGRAMASRRTAKEWKHALTVLKSAPWQLLGMDTEVLVPLQGSYDYLPNDMIRLCLLYCSLFPEEFSIPKDSIMGYCIGEGFTDDLYTVMDEEFSFFKDWAKIASLQERGEDADHIRIHPMVRAMALWIASEFGRRETKWLVRAGDRLREALSADKWSDAERISFMHNNIVELYERPNCPLLKMLLLQGNPLSRICDGFFQFMPSLRVLDLSQTSLSELPSGIGSLRELQYLDLHNTNIRSLPMELESLVNLRFLIISNVPLQMIPGGVICSLTMLQVLYMYHSYGDWKVGDSGNGVDFQELESLRRLQALDITIQSREALEQLSRSYRLAVSTRNLLINACSSLTNVELRSGKLWKNMTSLKRVCIVSCSNLAEVTIDHGEEADDRIAHSLSKPQRTQIVDEEQHILPNLHDLILQGLHKVKIIYRGACVPNLASLFIQHCHGLEELLTLSDKDQEMVASGGEEAPGTTKVIIPFPNLKELHLHDLAKFRTLSSGICMLQFPSLEALKIVECPKLKKLKFCAPGLNAIQCSREWWDGLQWENKEVKASFELLLDSL